MRIKARHLMLILFSLSILGIFLVFSISFPNVAWIIHVLIILAFCLYASPLVAYIGLFFFLLISKGLNNFPLIYDIYAMVTFVSFRLMMNNRLQISSYAPFWFWIAAVLALLLILMAVHEYLCHAHVKIYDYLIAWLGLVFAFPLGDYFIKIPLKKRWTRVGM